MLPQANTYRIGFTDIDRLFCSVSYKNVDTRAIGMFLSDYISQCMARKGDTYA